MRLGIAVYPEKSKKKLILNYIEQAHRHGFSHLFFNLLGEVINNAKALADIRDITRLARTKGWTVVADVNPAAIKALGFEFDSQRAVKFFSDMDVTTLRLDEDFGGEREAKFTNLPDNPLAIEVNASGFNGMVQRMVRHKADMSKVTACHNFYPQKYTGLGIARFVAASQEAKASDMKVAAFLALDPSKPSIGPWDVNDGQPTVEFLRDKPLAAQTRFYAATGLVDTVVLGQMFATEDEMAAIARNAEDCLTLALDVDRNVTDEERTIAFTYDKHEVRGDYSDYVLRSTRTRVVYKEFKLPARKSAVKTFRRGDVLIVNNKYGRYKGELHVVLQDMPNDGLKNLIGRLPEAEVKLLDFIRPWQKMRLVDRASFDR